MKVAVGRDALAIGKKRALASWVSHVFFLAGKPKMAFMFPVFFFVFFLGERPKRQVLFIPGSLMFSKKMAPGGFLVGSPEKVGAKKGDQDLLAGKEGKGAPKE